MEGNFLRAGAGGAGFNSVCGADPGGRGRPCDLQRQVPAVQVVHVLGAPDSVHRQSAGPPYYATETCSHSATVQKTGEIPQVHFLDKVVGIPVGVQRLVPGLRQRRKLWKCRGCSSSTRLSSAGLCGDECFFWLFFRPFFALLQVVWS